MARIVASVAILAGLCAASHRTLLTLPWQRSCRSRDSMQELASSGPPLPRRTAWCTGRRVWVTMRELDSTATSETMARLTLSNTLLVLMVLEFLVEITSQAEVKTPLMPSQ